MRILLLFLLGSLPLSFGHIASADRAATSVLPPRVPGSASGSASGPASGPSSASTSALMPFSHPASAHPFLLPGSPKTPPRIPPARKTAAPLAAVLGIPNGSTGQVALSPNSQNEYHSPALASTLPAAPANLGAFNIRSPLSPLSGDQLFQRARENVFKLSFRDKGARSEIGHGSAFAVRRNGYLITNFHVVAQAVERPDKYELVLAKDGGTLPAKVVTIDAVNDLALVKVEASFPAPLELKPEAPSVAGESAFSFGFPQSEALNLAQGNLNGERQMGFGAVLTGTMPINHGMSGGPCLNVYGQVVGVNRAIQVDAQNISYFSPWSALHTIADHANQFHAFNGDQWRGYAVDQIERQEKRSLSLALNESKDTGDHSQKFGHLSFRAPFDSGCGQSSQSSEGKIKQAIFVCRGVSLSLLGEESSALNVTTYASSSGASVFGKFQTLASGAAVDARYNQIKAQNQKSAGRSPSSEVLREICNAKNVRNENGLLLTVRYCSLALEKFSGLYATAFRIEHLDKKGERVSFGQLYEGVTMPTTLRLMQYFIESLEEAAP